MFHRLILSTILVFLVCRGASHGSPTTEDPLVAFNFVRARNRLTAVNLADETITYEASKSWNVDSLVADDPFFFDDVSDNLDFVQPGTGAVNRGEYKLFQHTTASPDFLTTSLSQSVMTETDFGFPGVNSEARLDAEFQVDRRGWIELEGTVVGSHLPGSPEFSRVLFQENGVNRFHSGIGEFPFRYALEPGKIYSIQARVAGQANFNANIKSELNFTMSVLSPEINRFEFVDGNLLVAYADPDGPKVVHFPDGGIPRNYAIVGNDGVQTGGVEFDVHFAEDGFVVTGMDVKDPNTMTMGFFGLCQRGRCQCNSGFEAPFGLAALAPLESECASIPPSRFVPWHLGDVIVTSIVPMVASRGPASGQPFQDGRYGAALVEIPEGTAIADWKWWGAEETEIAVENPRLTALEIGGSSADASLRLVDGPAGRMLAAIATSDQVTLYDLGDLSVAGALSPLVLASLQSANGAFNPSMLNVQPYPGGEALVAIQEANTLHLYEYKNNEFHSHFQQPVTDDANGKDIWSNEADFYLYELDDKLFRGRIHEPPHQQMQFGNVLVHLNDATPENSPSSFVSLDGNASATIDGTYVPPSGANLIQVVAAKDAEMVVTDNVDPDELGRIRIYDATGNRAGIMAETDTQTTAKPMRLVSRGETLARTFAMPAVEPTMGNQLIDPAFADHMIERANPAAMAALREALGKETVGAGN